MDTEAGVASPPPVPEVVPVPKKLESSLRRVTSSTA